MSHRHHDILPKPAAALFTLATLLLLAGCGSSDNSGVRLFNVSQDYTSLNVYVGSTATTPSIGNVPTGSLSSYVGIDPGSNTVYFTEGANTQSDPLTSQSETFSTGEHRTYVAYGDTGGFAEHEIDEDQGAPGGGQASVEVLNSASDAGVLDVYLSSSGAPLGSVPPTFSGVAAGQTTSFSSVAAGTYELSITGTGNESDVRLQIPSITLNSQEVVTIIVTESAGGYLVNAYILPQQGSLTTELNPDARVRAVVGLATGSAVSATIGSTALLSNAPADSVGTYQLVPAGTQPVSVTVGGVSVSSPSQALAAGQDYTLLIYQGASGPEENWLVDINRFPASSDASVRLVHAMAGLTDPISLSVDSVPVITDVSPSEASSYDTGVAASTTSALSVIDATTSQQLYSQSPVTLSSQGIYTLFMFGSASSPNGVLNQDR